MHSTLSVMSSLVDLSVKTQRSGLDLLYSQSSASVGLDTKVFVSVTIRGGGNLAERFSQKQSQLSFFTN